MSCLDENTAALFMQGGLRGDAARAVELHLDGCRACGALLAEVARIYVSSASSLDHPTSHVRRSGPPVAPGALVAPGDSAMAVGRYHLAGVLGAGGMGVVFAAFDPMLQRRVALKLVRPDLEGSSRSDVQVRLVREAQSVARIAHPNVVTVYDVGFVGVHVFFAMELVEGPTFRQWLAQSPRTPRDILDVMLQAGRGLDAIHRAGLVHCDVKPDNIIVGLDGRARISDLGLAAAASSPSGELGGTPAYMAPERVHGAPASAAGDQWSFAATLFEGLFGARPPNVRSWEEMRRAPSIAPPGSLPAERSRGVPAWAESVVRKGLSPHPEWRFASMSALCEALTGGDRSGPTHVRASLYVQGAVWLTQAAFWSFSLFHAATSEPSPASPASPVAAAVDRDPMIPEPYMTFVVFFLIATVTWGPISVLWMPANAYGLWRRRAWARVSTLIFGLFSLLSCVGLPFGIYLVYAMTRPSVRAELDR